MTRTTLGIVCLLAAGCRNDPPAPAASAFRDPQGNPVTVDPLPARRIVSTMQSATEWLVALGAGERLVARTTFDRQPELAHLPSLGGGLEVSAEAVAALDPDVVLGWRTPGSVDLANALTPFGIPVVAVEAADTAEAFRQLHLLGRLVGLEADADRLAGGLRAELTSLRARHCPPGTATESVLVVLWTEPPMTTGQTSWMSELLGAACLHNAFDDLASAWPPPVSMEAIAARQPRWILTSRADTAGGRLAEYRAMSMWRNLEAVRAGRILELDGDLFARAGPGMADWVRAVVAERERVLAVDKESNR